MNAVPDLAQLPAGSTLAYRAIFISDIHLGTRGCKADFLLDFLKHTESEKLFLVGDIIDGWRLKKSWYWQQAHNDVVQKLLRKARKGTEVIYVPGNHDEFARDYTDYAFGDVQVHRRFTHITVDGRKFLVTHGDECDGVMIYARWLAVLGDSAYGAALALNSWFNAARRHLGLPYWSLSKYLKHKVKNAVQFINNYEGAMARLAREHGADGVICGHIHHAVIRDIDGITYCNDGDWVESCTALVEHFDGRLEIIHWADARGLVPGTTLLSDSSDLVLPLSLTVSQKALLCASSSSPMPGTLKSTVSSEP